MAYLTSRDLNQNVRAPFRELWSETCISYLQTAYHTTGSLQNGWMVLYVPIPNRLYVIAMPVPEKLRSPQGPVAQFTRSPKRRSEPNFRLPLIASCRLPGKLTAYTNPDGVMLHGRDVNPCFLMKFCFIELEKKHCPLPATEVRSCDWILNRQTAFSEMRSPGHKLTQSVLDDV